MILYIHFITWLEQAIEFKLPVLYKELLRRTAEFGSVVVIFANRILSTTWL